MKSKLPRLSVTLLLMVPSLIVNVSLAERLTTAPSSPTTQPGISIEPHFRPGRKRALCTRFGRRKTVVSPSYDGLHFFLEGIPTWIPTAFQAV